MNFLIAENATFNSYRISSKIHELLLREITTKLERKLKDQTINGRILFIGRLDNSYTIKKEYENAAPH